MSDVYHSYFSTQGKSFTHY